MSDDLISFLLDMDRIEAEIPRAHRDYQAALAAVGYERVVDRSPVRTGAFRSENVIAEEEQAVQVIFEPRDRAGPDTRVSGNLLEFIKPSAADAYSALVDVKPFDLITLVNDRYYAIYLEDGSSKQAPNGIYGPAADHLNSVASRRSIELTGSIRGRTR
jgi:hypothetical protein